MAVAKSAMATALAMNLMNYTSSIASGAISEHEALRRFHYGELVLNLKNH
jgi:hypothetical protein